jgi:hypothetical protein
MLLGGTPLSAFAARRGQAPERFDHAVLACAAPQSRKLLAEVHFERALVAAGSERSLAAPAVAPAIEASPWGHCPPFVQRQAGFGANAYASHPAQP